MGPEVLCHVIIYILSPLLHSIDHKHITVTEYSRGGYYTDMNVRKQGSLPSLYPFYFFFKNFQTKLQRGRKLKGDSSDCQFSPQMTTMTGEPSASSRSLRWIDQAKQLGHLLHPCQIHWQGLEVKQPRHESVPIWDTSEVFKSLTC